MGIPRPVPPRARDNVTTKRILPQVPSGEPKSIRKELKKEDEISRVHLQSSPRNVMSYSGADFTFLLHVPVAANSNQHQVAIDEIQDEIYELENIVLQLSVKEIDFSQLALTNPSMFASLESVRNRKREIEKRIARLGQIQGELRKSKANIIPRRIQTLQTLSYQIHVDKQPVRALGHSYPKGYTRGAKLIAGSMIFTVINEHPLVSVIDTLNAGLEFDGILPNFSNKGSTKSYDMFPSTATVDHLPPMHLTVLGVNEAGNAVNFTLFGLEFVNDGMVLSIQDILTESTIQFVAQDIDIMRTLDTRGVENIPAMSRAVTASSFLSGPVAAARRARRGLPF